MGNNPHEPSGISFTGLVFYVCLCNSLAFSQSTWRTDGTLPDIGESCYSIAYGNNRYVATGQYGTIVTSHDSIDWFGRAADIPDILLWSVTFGNGAFLTAGSNTILTSLDGVTWTGQAIETDDYLIAATYGNGTYVAVGTRGTIFTSTNGTTWSDRSLENNTGDFYSICFGNNLFVALAVRATEELQSAIFTSSDAISWTATKSTPMALWYVTFGNGLFVAVGDSGMIITSTDGVRWTRQSTGTTAQLMSATWGNGSFVTVGYEGTILTSPDGYNWNDRTYGSDKKLYSVTCGSDQFVAIGDGGAIITAPLDNAATGCAGSGEASLTDAKSLNFNFGTTTVRFKLPADAPDADCDAGLFTIRGQRVYTARINYNEIGTNIAVPRCAPGTYLLTVAGLGKRWSMPVTIAR
jgi:hypothetical protein